MRSSSSTSMRSRSCTKDSTSSRSTAAGGCCTSTAASLVLEYHGVLQLGAPAAAQEGG